MFALQMLQQHLTDQIHAGPVLFDQITNDGDGYQQVYREQSDCRLKANLDNSVPREKLVKLFPKKFVVKCFESHIAIV